MKVRLETKNAIRAIANDDIDPCTLLGTHHEERP